MRHAILDEPIEIDEDDRTTLGIGMGVSQPDVPVLEPELVQRVDDYGVDADAARRVHSVNVRGFASLPTTVKVR